VKTLPGIAASRGIAIGPVFQFRRAARRFERRTVEDQGAEWGRFEAALEMDSAEGVRALVRERVPSVDVG
jgi:phosphoenolpyruvate-protein kinase (PTS system EI component)